MPPTFLLFVSAIVLAAISPLLLVVVLGALAFRRLRKRAALVLLIGSVAAAGVSVVVFLVAGIQDSLARTAAIPLFWGGATFSASVIAHAVFLLAQRRRYRSKLDKVSITA